MDAAHYNVHYIFMVRPLFSLFMPEHQHSLLIIYIIIGTYISTGNLFSLQEYSFSRPVATEYFCYAVTYLTLFIA